MSQPKDRLRERRPQDAGFLSTLTRWWASQSGASRATAIGGGAIVLSAIAGVVLLIATAGGGAAAGPSAKGGGSGPGILTPTATPPPLVAGVASGSRDAQDEEDKPKPDPDPRNRLPLVRTLEGLKQYGDPPGTNYARLRIPSQGVNAVVGARIVGANGVMPDPAGPADVAWYDLSAFGMGGTPGGGGNAVFSGHVDYADVVPYANVRYQGVGVFFNLNRLSPGDIIEIDFRGQALRYAVEWRRQVSETSNWNELLTSEVPRDSITLITCGGDFDLGTRSYAGRTVVRAVRL